MTTNEETFSASSVAVEKSMLVIGFGASSLTEYATSAVVKTLINVLNGTRVKSPALNIFENADCAAIDPKNPEASSLYGANSAPALVVNELGTTPVLRTSRTQLDGTECFVSAASACG